ncbi:MAG: hypothetical protein ACLQUY_23700 [Ktedonobacterales bacterium]
MNCPRCGQKIPLASFGRCPACGQPLYAPTGQPSRVIKLAPQSESTLPASSHDPDGWPDLTTPQLTQPETGQLDPSRAMVWPPSGGKSRKLLSIILAAALILIVVSGGTLLLLAGIHQQDTSSKSVAETETARKVPATATSLPRIATAVATSTTPPSPVPTQAAGQGPTAIPTQPPTAIATATPQLVTVFSDPLTGNANGWPVQNGCSFADGGYQVNGGAECLAPVMASDTVNISVQMTSMGWTMEGAGIGFRIPTGQSEQQYSFYLYSTGTCMAEDQANNTTFFDNTACSAVNEGADAVNTLAIDQSGAQMNFYVNGTLVGSAEGATLSGGGIALEAHKFGPPVIFNNFVLTTWQ